MKYTISKENYELLQKIVELAESRLPLQGGFDIETINGYLLEEGETKEGIKYVGSKGDLLGGFLPLIDSSRFMFDSIGRLLDYDSWILWGRFYKEIGNKLFEALFFSNSQNCYDNSLTDISEYCTQKEAVENLKNIIDKLVVIVTETVTYPNNVTIKLTTKESDLGRYSIYFRRYLEDNFNLSEKEALNLAYTYLPINEYDNMKKDYPFFIPYKDAVNRITELNLPKDIVLNI